MPSDTVEWFNQRKNVFISEFKNPKSFQQLPQMIFKRKKEKYIESKSKQISQRELEEAEKMAKMKILNSVFKTDVKPSKMKRGWVYNKNFEYKVPKPKKSKQNLGDFKSHRELFQSKSLPQLRSMRKRRNKMPMKKLRKKMLKKNAKYQKERSKIDSIFKRRHIVSLYI